MRSQHVDEQPVEAVLLRLAGRGENPTCGTAGELSARSERSGSLTRRSPLLLLTADSVGGPVRGGDAARGLAPARLAR
jgi:hypothetical protein